MIDLPITLLENGDVQLPGYAWALVLGYAKNKGVYRLVITTSGEWQGLTIRACWHIPGAETTCSSLVANGLCEVPAAVTAVPGRGVCTFEGTDGAGITITSADLPYLVGRNSGTDDGSVPQPGTSAWEAFVAQTLKTALPMATREEVKAMFDEIFEEDK